MPVSSVSHASPSDIRGGSPSSDSTTRRGIARSDSTNLRVLPSRSAEPSLSSSDAPGLDSQASSSDEEDDERTISTVATDADTAAADADASSICGMLHDDPEFDSLRLNSVVTSRVPKEAMTTDGLEEGEWTDNEVVEDKVHKNIQELKISEMATGSILTAN